MSKHIPAFLLCGDRGLQSTGAVQSKQLTDLVAAYLGTRILGSVLQSAGIKVVGDNGVKCVVYLIDEKSLL